MIIVYDDNQEYMNERPIGRKENIVTAYMKTHIGTAALFITIGVLGIYFNVANIKDLILHSVPDALKEATIRTFIFTFFIYSVIFNSLNTRSTGINVFNHILENKKFIVVMGSIAIVQSFIIQYGGKVFSTVSMDMKHFVLALFFASLIIPVDFIRKSIVNRK